MFKFISLPFYYKGKFWRSDEFPGSITIFFCVTFLWTCWCHVELFDVLNVFLVSWQTLLTLSITFWRYDENFDIMTNCLIYAVFLMIHPTGFFLRHDVFLTPWRIFDAVASSLIRDELFDVMTCFWRNQYYKCLSKLNVLLVFKSGTKHHIIFRLVTYLSYAEGK